MAGLDREAVARARRAVEAVEAGLRRWVEKGRLAEGSAGEVRATTDDAQLAPARLLVEAVAEDLAVKQQLFHRLEAVVGADCVLATNTSSLSIDAIAAGLADPTRLVGMHFFNPAPVMALVEVVSGLRTGAAAADLVEATAERWGKTPVRCGSSPGFLVNRVARGFYSEPLRVVEETGLAPEVVDTLFRDAGGFRLGPLQVVDLIGNDVNAAVTASVWHATGLDPRYRPSGLQQQYVDAGWLGRKTGRGFYDHTAATPSVAADIRPEPDSSHPGDLPSPGPVRVGPACALRPLLARTGAPLEDDPAAGAWAVLPSGALVGLTDGDLAAAHAAREGRDVVLVDLAIDWAAVPRVGATSTAPAARGTPAEQVDTAVRLGLSYPLGPLAWGDRVGPAYLVALLDRLERLMPGGRFRVSTALRRAALTGTPLGA
jgi:3-hydroxybutyryl-CoA dehydrogenase